MRTVLLILFAISLQAQQFQLGQAKTTAPAGLRARPDRNSLVIYSLPASAPLRVIDTPRIAGFAKVIGEKGPVGWVPVETLEVTAPPAIVPCIAEVAAPKKSDAPVILDFNDILKLQLQAERSGRPSSVPTARISGVLAAIPTSPCPTEDWLLNIGPDAASKDYEGLIARVSRVKRNPRWTAAKLDQARLKHYPILITGNLFYDARSVVNDDAKSPIPGQLHRAYLWELRNVTSILVCTSGGCDIGSPTGWVALDALN